MPTFTIHHLDGHLEHIAADELIDDGRHRVLLGTNYVMNQPRTIVLRRLRHGDVAAVTCDDADLPASQPAQA